MRYDKEYECLGVGTCCAHGFGRGFRLRGPLATYAVSIGSIGPASYNSPERSVWHFVLELVDVWQQRAVISRFRIGEISDMTGRGGQTGVRG